MILHDIQPTQNGIVFVFKCANGTMRPFTLLIREGMSAADLAANMTIVGTNLGACEAPWTTPRWAERYEHHVMDQSVRMEVPQIINAEYAETPPEEA